MSENHSGSFPDLTPETKAIWDQNADWWDQQIGDGNVFQQQLIGPATERLLEVRAGQVILDLACGNGVVSRRLAEQGAQVLACDFSPTFLERAKARTTAVAERIEYRLVDLTERQQLLSLGERRFDAAVCNMALMDMATISPLLDALSVLLKPMGRFVFSVLHPCFNTTGCTMLAEQVDEGGQLRTLHSVRETVPVRIVIALVPKLRLCGFWYPKDRFPEFLKTLENRSATAWVAASLFAAVEPKRACSACDAGGPTTQAEPTACDGDGTSIAPAVGSAVERTHSRLLTPFTTVPAAPFSSSLAGSGIASASAPAERRRHGSHSPR